MFVIVVILLVASYYFRRTVADEERHELESWTVESPASGQSAVSIGLVAVPIQLDLG